MEDVGEEEDDHGEGVEAALVGAVQLAFGEEFLENDDDGVEETCCSHWLMASVEISPYWLHCSDLFLVSTVMSALMGPQLCSLLS